MPPVAEEYDLTSADVFQAPLIQATEAGASLRATTAGPFLLSFVLHLGAVLAFSYLAVAGQLKSDRFMLVAAPATQPVEFQSLPRATQIEVDSSITLNAVPAVEKTGDVGESLPSPLSVVSDRGPTAVGNSLLNDVMGLFKGEGDGFGESGEGQGGAEFFGVRAAGNRFVFVVDSSRSMRGRKWMLACRELLASVDRLNPNQSFYVIFFDVDTHPMFSQKKPERELLSVTTSNKRRLLRWLPSIKLGPDTRPLHSVQWALAMKPDAVFLLSDGEFTDGTRAYLLGENQQIDEEGVRSPKVPIHTVGFHSLAAEAMLRPIAADNGGEYRFVPR